MDQHHMPNSCSPFNPLVFFFPFFFSLISRILPAHSVRSQFPPILWSHHFHYVPAFPQFRESLRILGQKTAHIPTETSIPLVFRGELFKSCHTFRAISAHAFSVSRCNFPWRTLFLTCKTFSIHHTMVPIRSQLLISLQHKFLTPHH